MSYEVHRVELKSHPDREFLRQPIRTPGRRVWNPPSPVGELTSPIVGARFVQEGGEEIQAALDALPPERRALGLAGISVELLHSGDEATRICRPAHVEFELMHGGQMFEARYEANSYFLHTEPVVELYALSSTCTDALLATSGVVADAIDNGCAHADQAAHFAVGSRCRTCLEIDGDHGRCVTEGQCRTEMARSVLADVDGTTQWVDVVRAPVLACAPSYMGELIYLTRDLGDDNEPPGPFDHSLIEQLCFEAWDDRTNALEMFCVNQPPQFMGIINFAIADLLIGRVEYIRRPGATNEPYHHRLYLSGPMEIDGMTFVGTPLYPGALAEVSQTPGWGYEPYGFRPDGESRARDYLAVIALKTATTIDGVPIGTYNHNVCTDAEWRGPDAMGRYHCKLDPGPEGPPDQEGWDYDWAAQLYSENPFRLDIFPLVTLGATGYYDPNIPGGHVPHVLGTSVLANPLWDDCAWPEQFVPDEISNQDGVGFDPYTFTGQTYRFGKDPNLDLRVVLSTNWRRGFCFESIDGL